MLSSFHESIEVLAADLMRDRPDLANALLLQAMNVPRPRPATRRRRERSPQTACARLPTLLYGALDAGVVDGRKFDRIMVLKARAARTLRARP